MKTNHFPLATLIVIVLLVLSFVLCLYGAELPPADQEKIADAIYRVEGGEHTSHPYGILSVKTDNPRKVCITTIRRNFERWQKSRETNFFEFLGNRYCPPSVDQKGNHNWKSNIISILGPRFVAKINQEKH